MSATTLHFRQAEIDSAVEESGNVKLSFASELPVLRNDGDGDFYEVLSHEPGDANFGFINRKGLALQDHNEKLEIGDVVRDSVAIGTDKKTRGEIKLYDTCWQTRIKQEPSKIPVSVGYVRLSVVSESKGADGIPIRRYSWSPYEVSLLTVRAADSTVGINRQKETREIDFFKLTSADIAALTNEQRQHMKLLLNPDPAAGGGTPAAAPAADSQKALALERSRVKEITAVANELTKNHPHVRAKIAEITNEAIAGDTSLGDYQIRAMKEVLGAKPVVPITMEVLGLSEAEQRAYSVLRGIQSCLKRNASLPDGLEGEVHAEMSKRAQGSAISFEGFAVPHDARVRCRPSRSQQRDLNVSTFAQGGATVQTSIVTPIIELLRNKMVTDKLGITSMAGLSGNCAIPRQTGAATAYALAESATLTKSTQALDQILLAPHRVGATNDYTRQLLIQSSIDVENFIRDDLMKVIAIKWDALILNGQGAGSEPLGILNTPGIGSVNFGGTCTYAKAIAFETALAVLNADGGNMAFATTPEVRGAWKGIAAALSGATAVINGAQNAIWAPSGTPGEGEVNGYRAVASKQIPNNLVIFGNWSEVVHGLYGGYDVIVNPYSRDVDAAVRITINTFGDVALRHAASFCASADAGNQ